MNNFLQKHWRRILIAIMILFALAVFRGSEDDWICDNGEWVKHGAPSALMPEGECD
jgi:hypothetical protein